ncbi:hypothetical protein B0H14DRAFT_3510258 [Mycena olivaceomarginata]|nr:hypothetical protein B0H14DRAFT_3510258 [Mycena olivaceomarginata]
MRFLSTSITALATLVALVVASSSKRAGTIDAPTAGTSISTGSSIPFGYGAANWCHNGYSPITIWLSGTVPTALNATGGLPEGTYIEYYGNYLEDNFNIGPLPPVPPTSLTIPDISSYPTGSNLFLSVVEEALPGTCPGGVSQPAQYEFTSVSLMVV